MHKIHNMQSNKPDRIRIVTLLEHFWCAYCHHRCEICRSLSTVLSSSFHQLFTSLPQRRSSTLQRHIQPQHLLTVTLCSSHKLCCLEPQQSSCSFQGCNAPRCCRYSEEREMLMCIQCPSVNLRCIKKLQDVNISKHIRVLALSKRAGQHFNVQVLKSFL